MSALNRKAGVLPTLVVILCSLFFSLVPFGYNAVAAEKLFISDSEGIPLIALPYDEPFRVEAPFPPNSIQPLSVSISVNFLSVGDTLYGYSCEAWPANAQTAFNYAASIWAGLLQSSVPINISACWANMGSSSILGRGGSSYYSDTFPPYAESWYSMPLLNALSGYDNNGASPEITVVFNNLYSWYFNTTGTPASGQYDFVSVVLHEVGHGLGFSGSMKIDDGVSTPSIECDNIAGYGCWGYGYSIPVIYDRFTTNALGDSLIDTGVFPNPSVALANELKSNDIYFDGLNATTANGGVPVKLYAPTTWASGSSYSHLNSSTYSSTENALMVPAIPSMTVRHSPGPVTLCLFKDLGWIVPSTCDGVTLSAYSNTFDYQGGSASVNIQNGGCCEWTALSNATSWLHITSGASGLGNGTVNYLVDLYTGATQRTGTMTIAGHTFTVTQNGNPPVAEFTYSQSNSTIPSNVFFTDTSTNASSWYWDFKDGDVSYERHPVHTYQTSGTYSVVLSVNGGASTVSHDVVVSATSCPNFPAQVVGVYMSGTSLMDAYAHVDANGQTIRIQALDQGVPPAFDFNGIYTNIVLGGGYDCDYNAARAFTLLDGLVTIGGSGSVIMDRIIIL